MAHALQLVVNGQPREIAVAGEDVSLENVIGLMGLKADRVAVELNGTIVRRAAWDATPVQAMDRLEVVHFVGGGIF